MFLLAFLLFFLPDLGLATARRPRQRYRYGDAGWPDDRTWQAFNESVSGRLVRTFPSAAVCHQDQYDADRCAEARADWSNSFWRTNQSGAYTAMAWEVGDQQCLINGPDTDPCEQGLGEERCTWRLASIDLLLSSILLNRC